MIRKFNILRLIPVILIEGENFLLDDLYIEKMFYGKPSMIIAKKENVKKTKSEIEYLCSESIAGLH